MSKRFLIAEKQITVNKDIINIDSKDVNHIKALRCNAGDKININKYIVEIKSINKTTLVGKIVDIKAKTGEPKVDITLIQSYLKSDKTEFVLQKAVELGIKNFIPVISENTVIKIDSKDKLKKKERLEKIKTEAIMQCGRTDEVNVFDIVSIKEVDYSSYSHIILCYEEGSINIKDIMPSLKIKIDNNTKVAVIIGPEGGFSKNEIEFIKERANNTKVVVFGERILKAETAAIYILSILDYELNN